MMSTRTKGRRAAHQRPASLLLNSLLLTGLLLQAAPTRGETSQAGETSSTSGGSSFRNWHWSGYATLAYADLASDQARSFARDLTQDRPNGAELDSRLGLQLNVALSHQLSLTGQVVARHRAADAPIAQALEWAFLAYQPRPEWLLRLGRTSPDVFLFADVRNLGVAYTGVRPNQEFYAWMPLQSLDGIDASRLWVGEDATWKLKAAFGQARATLVAQRGGTSAPGRLQGTGTLTLSRETPSLTLKASYLRGTLDLSRAAPLIALDTALAQLASLPIPFLASQATALRDAAPLTSRSRYFSLGAQYDDGQWLLAAELSHARGRARQATTQRGYLSLGRRVNDWTLFVQAGASVLPNPPLQVPDWQTGLTPLVGPLLAAQAQGLAAAATATGNQARASQRSQGFGLRWDVLPQTALKFQWDRVRVDADGSALWETDSTAALRARIASLAVDVTF